MPDDNKKPKSFDEWLAFGELLAQNSGVTNREKYDYVVGAGLDCVHKVDRSNALWLYKKVNEGYDFSACPDSRPSEIRKWYRIREKGESGALSVVYILTNQYMPELVKIGITKGYLESRLRVINSSTSIPGPFVASYYLSFSKDMLLPVERAMHQCFNDQRVSVDREFFKLSAKRASKALDLFRSRIDAGYGTDFTEYFLHQVYETTEHLDHS
ncbi:MAG: GIY-YIG nuclease family protein [Pseudomonadales bacterium]|nr:GIY-YIG nuclease family protein [Pseudomonadales bacterium]